MRDCKEFPGYLRRRLDVEHYRRPVRRILLHRQWIPDELCPGFEVSTDEIGNLSVLQIAVPADLSVVVGHAGIFHRDGVRRVAAPVAGGRLECDLSVRIGLARSVRALPSTIF